MQPWSRLTGIGTALRSRSLLAVLAALGCDGTAPAVTGTATPPAQDERIVFVAGGQVESEIYSIRPDGSDQTRLTTSPGFDGYPRWSPDGARIAFVSSRDGRARVYLMNADGSGIVRLTDEPPIGAGLAWSPDGRSIAFTAAIPGGLCPGSTAGLWTMKSDGTDAKLIAYECTAFYQFPDWSPDGSKIAYARDYSGPNPTGPFHEIVVLDLQTMVRTDFLPTRRGGGGGGGGLIGVRSFRWSPDGRRIAFGADIPPACGSPNPGIYVADADGSNLALLTPVPASCFNPPQHHSPEWSPDGTRIVFETSQQLVSLAPDRLFAMASDGSNSVPLTSMSAWSPSWRKARAP